MFFPDKFFMPDRDLILTGGASKKIDEISRMKVVFFFHAGAADKECSGHLVLDQQWQCDGDVVEETVVERESDRVAFRCDALSFQGTDLLQRYHFIMFAEVAKLLLELFRGDVTSVDAPAVFADAMVHDDQPFVGRKGPKQLAGSRKKQELANNLMEEKFKDPSHEQQSYAIRSRALLLLLTMRLSPPRPFSWR